jgi:hypothetical protein
MRGFQPQNYADGGLVQGVKRLFGMDEERNARVAAYRAQQAQEKAQKAAEAKAAEQPKERAITGYSGMSATQRREKELGLKDGGRVRPRGFVAGPGTETSDSIPARLSDGEYVLAAQPAVGFQPAGVVAPVVRHSGNDWQARNDLRNAQVSASSIMNNGSGWDSHRGMSPERTAYKAAVDADFAARGAQPGVDVAAMRENAGIQREGMQQAGATDRAARGFVVDRQRLGIEGRRADSEISARGFQSRAAGRLEKLQDGYMAAKTPEERTAIAQQIRDLSGKATNPKDDLLVVGGGQEWDATANTMRNVPQRVFDARKVVKHGVPPIPNVPKEIA